MSTSPEKSARLPIVLQSRHQWLRWRGMLIVGIIGLTVTLIAVWMAHGSWQVAQHRFGLEEIWIGGLLATLGVVVIASRLAPESLLVTARLLDGRFAAKGRLEAAAILKDSTSPLAQAQREETALYLARETQARAVRVLPWLRGIVVVLVLAHILTLMLWFAPSFASFAKPVIATTQPLPPPPDANTPPASIIWQSPEAATQANPTADIPAEATVQSPTGMKDLTLEVSVNGQIKKSIPLPAETANTPGSHEVKIPLHLDDLKVQPFDVVSYYLHGQPLAAQAQPEVTSPVQFVQVRPFRDTGTPGQPATNPPGVTAPDSAPEVLNRLETAELQAMQDNFALEHSGLAPTDPARAQETERVSKEQAALASQTDAIAKALADEHQPDSTLNPLHQAEPLMDDSGKKIAANQNDTAAAAQQKALDLILQGEKAAYQAPTPVAPPAAANSNNSFTDSAPHTLSPRQQTLVGELETLAKNQTSLAQDMGQDSDDTSSSTTTSPTSLTASTPTPMTSPPPPPNAPNPATTTSTPPPTSPPVDPFSPDADKGSLAERQERVIKGITTLEEKTNALPPAGNEALTSAQKDGAQSLQQLSAEQPAAAREPAAAAALDLQQTLRALNQAGDADTRQTLAQAQQQLNAVATQLRGLAQSHPADAASHLMDMATEVRDVQEGLESAADHQQNAGSAQGAARLNTLASELQDQKVAPNLADMSKSGLDPGRASAQADALEHLAGDAAAGMTPAQPSSQDYAGLANSLERTEATLAHLADKAGGTPGDNSTMASTSGSQQSQQPAPNTAANSSDSQPGQQPTPIPASNATGSQPSQQPAPNTAANAPGSQPTQQPAANTPAQTPGSPSSTPNNDPALAQAYQEALQDLKNQTQQTAKLVPSDDAAAVDQVIVRYDKDTNYRDVKGVDVVRFHTDLQQPLAKLILDVQNLQQHAQRSEIVRTPDLDEAPAAYRPAVSRYFEDVSRDYHAPATPVPPAP